MGASQAHNLSIEDEEALERLALAYTPKFQGIREAVREQIRETGGLGHQGFWQEMEAETPYGLGPCG